jgi:hypothetical protein
MGLAPLVGVPTGGTRQQIPIFCERAAYSNLASMSSVVSWRKLSTSQVVAAKSVVGICYRTIFHKP